MYLSQGSRSAVALLPTYTSSPVFVRPISFFFFSLSHLKTLGWIFWTIILSPVLTSDASISILRISASEDGYDISISIRIAEPCDLIFLRLCRYSVQWGHVSISKRLSANQRTVYANVNDVLTEHKHKHKKKAHAYVADVLTSALVSYAYVYVYAYACVASEDRPHLTIMSPIMTRRHQNAHTVKPLLPYISLLLLICMVLICTDKNM